MSNETQRGLEPKYRSYFLDYASYVILDRAIPALEDGLKPVQRRILHSLWDMDDGRYNKVANVVGNTMRYHPHGDASITDALVGIGQKELLIDCQGNWGNYLTGDPAAAGRYIEARLNAFAKDVLFSPRVTKWLPSYDGRSQEPETLPVKFPLLLALGTEGIAVGLTTKILPHNPLELCTAAIQYLKDQPYDILPDFLTGGFADFTEYNGGKSGGKIKVRAKIEVMNSKTLRIMEIPFETTTQSLVESILAAQEKGKVKIRKVEDNTAEHINILIHVSSGEDVYKVKDALFAFSDCEKSIYPSACVIHDGKPEFPSTNEILEQSVQRTKQILLSELVIDRTELLEKILHVSLEIVFVEKKIYQKIELAESVEDARTMILKGLQASLKSLNLHRDVLPDDLDRLLDMKIRRIAKYDLAKSVIDIEDYHKKLKSVDVKIKNINVTTIKHFERIAAYFGSDCVRRTEIASAKIVAIDKSKVAVTNMKLFVDYTDGFIGTSAKIGPHAVHVFDVSDAHRFLCFAENGMCRMMAVKDKAFVHKNLLLVSPWVKADDTTVYTVVYRDGPASGSLKLKRFTAGSMITDKDYDLTWGTEGSKILFVQVNKVTDKLGYILVKYVSRSKPSEIIIKIAEHDIKERDRQGVVVSPAGREVAKVTLLEM